LIVLLLNVVTIKGVLVSAFYSMLSADESVPVEVPLTCHDWSS